MAAIKIPLGEAPAVIRESAFHFMQAYGYVFAKRGDDGVLAEVGPIPTAEAFIEIGNNAAQALTAIDMYSDRDAGDEDDNFCSRCPAVGTCVRCDRHYPAPADILGGHP